jgi:hypothetical protein
MLVGAAVLGDEMVGRVGHVTATITPGHLGEVMVAVRGGSEAFNCYAVDPEETIPKGARVVIVEHYPPRTLVVSRT